mgnify:CR=1 FL=1
MGKKSISHKLRLGIADRLKYYRENNDISQEELAFAVDITQASISNYENGRSETPLSVLLAVADFFGISLLALLPEDFYEEFSQNRLDNLVSNRRIGSDLRVNEALDVVVSQSQEISKNEVISSTKERTMSRNASITSS